MSRHNRFWWSDIFCRSFITLLVVVGLAVPNAVAAQQRAEVHYTGKLKKLDGRSILLKLDDGRTLRIDRSGKTKLYNGSKQAKASEFGPGDQVSADATEDEQGFLFALRVTLERSATAEERQQALAEANERPAPRPVSADGRVDDGRPTLKRADPAALDTRASRPAPSGATNASTPDDSLIDKTREVTFEFADKLPNFLAEENMARFARETNAQGWTSLDVVSAEIIYENGQESYRNLKINGSPTTKKIEELSGAWSTGEFATTLNGLLHPDTHAQFRDGGDTAINGVRARVFDFEVEQENSHWKVQAGTQSLTAAYQGSLWIDPDTGRALRVEIQARNLPSDFPMDVVESAVDYSAVRIAGNAVLMPVRAESLGCQRGTHACSRNVIDFRNYRKYSSDTKIIFGEEEEK